MINLMDRWEVEAALSDGIALVNQVAGDVLVKNKIQYSVKADELFINQPAVVLLLSYEGYYYQINYHIEKLARKDVKEMVGYDIREAVHKFIEELFLKAQ